ncbi:TM2 domain-containing protein [Marinomonas sp.]
MKGKILGFSEEHRTGVISGSDAARYDFELEQWRGDAQPKVGNNVDFSVSDGKAESIYLDSPVSTGSSKKIAAALFAFFLGAFGAHKFYLGYTKQGVIMLSVFILGFILLGFPSMIIGIIAFIEFILYLVKTDEDFEEIYVTNKKPWF